MFSPALTVDALLLSSPLAVFMSQNVQDRHNRRGYNAENLEISIMVFFLLNWLHSFHWHCGLTLESWGDYGDMASAVRERPMQCRMDDAKYSF